MPRHNFNLTESQGDMIFNLLKSHRAALQNWITSAVESDDFDRAKKLAYEVRETDKLYACFNLEARREIAKLNGSEMHTEHTAR